MISATFYGVRIFRTFTVTFLVISVFQGVIRTCSYAPLVETENEADTAVVEDFNTKKITYKDFMDTWSGMLDVAKIKV